LAEYVAIHTTADVTGKFYFRIILDFSQNKSDKKQLLTEFYFTRMRFFGMI